MVRNLRRSEVESERIHDRHDGMKREDESALTGEYASGDLDTSPGGEVLSVPKIQRVLVSFRLRKDTPFDQK